MLFEIVMPSTKRQNAKARRSREMEILSIYGNMDIIPVWTKHKFNWETELEGDINGPGGHQDSELLPNRCSSSQENEIRDIDNENDPVRTDRLAESI